MKRWTEAATGAGEVAGAAARRAGERWASGQHADALTALAEAVEAARKAGAEACVVRLLTLSGERHLDLDDVDAAVAAFRAVLGHEVAGREEETELRARIGLAECRLGSGDVEAGVQAIDAVRGRLGAAPEVLLAERGRAALSVADVVRRDTVDGEAFDEAARTLSELGADASRWRLTMGRGAALSQGGYLTEAAASFREARAAWVQKRFPAGVGPAALAETRLLAREENYVEADISLEIALDAARAAGQRGALVECLELGVELALALGAPTRAVALLLESAGLARGLPQRVALLSQALSAALIRDLPETGAVADALSDTLAELGPEGLLPEAARSVALDLDLARRPEAAREVLLRGAQRAFSMGLPAESAECLAEAARLTERIGDAAQAQAMWEEVVGLGRHYDLIEAEAWEAEWRHRFPNG